MKSFIQYAAAAIVLATASFSAQAQQTSSATGSASATILRPIAVAKNQDLAFGSVVRGAGTVAVSNAGSRSVTGAVQALASTSASQAQFTVSGEGGQAITVTVPGSITLTKAGGTETLTVSTTNDLPASQSLSGSLGQSADGSLTVNVGGSITLAATTVTGAYAGTFQVSASYN